MKTVLVTDDQVETNHILCRLLRAHGYRAVSAFTGEGALAAMATGRPDLVILDAMMPGMDGIEVLRLIRSNPRTQFVPVIIASAIADPGFRAHAIEKGADDYWVKGSFDFSRLPEMIEKYLKRRFRNQGDGEGPLAGPTAHSGLAGRGL